MADGYRLPEGILVVSERHVEKRGIFYIGGSYKENSSGAHYMSGQMYVEVLVPEHIRSPYPAVFFHGAGQTGVNWLITPDGRPGWADYFLRQGYVVYLVDQPSRGRSAYHPEDGGALRYMAAERVQELFTRREGQKQWPGKGSKGDLIFDQFYASQVEYLGDARKTEELTTDAGKQLLEKIGPSILITHSQAGPFGWLLADRMAEYVKMIIALEPTGPPFSNINGLAGKTRTYGISEQPLTFGERIHYPEWFQDEESDVPSLNDQRQWVQAEPAGCLSNMTEIPVLLLTAEASYHRRYDHLTAAFLKQAGVPVEHVMLGEKGFHGNGHMFMLEENSEEIAKFVLQWIDKKINQEG